MSHLLDLEQMNRQQMIELLDLADHMAEVNRRPNPKVPALRGRTVCMAFFEDSTRTRLSFDLAARRLSADVMTFSAAGSSLNKGESLRDTIETLTAMGIDALVVRHRSGGVPAQITHWTSASVINAGDGWHAHPTQGLLDCHTVRSHLGGAGSLEGLRIAVVGDIRHSRVARSTIRAFETLGAELVLVAPRTLLPADPMVFDAEIENDLDRVIGDVDVLYLLRLQRERTDEALLPSVREYSTRFGLTSERVKMLKSNAVVMHPGPMNRGVEVVVDPASIPNCLITDQVTNGIAVRMAVLYQLLGSGRLEEETP
jgi:aspartate carbamoyltransferase catalytic subunit